jgi:hypothetical protein
LGALQENNLNDNAIPCGYPYIDHFWRVSKSADDDALLSSWYTPQGKAPNRIGPRQNAELFDAHLCIMDGPLHLVDHASDHGTLGMSTPCRIPHEQHCRAAKNDVWMKRSGHGRILARNSRPLAPGAYV